MNNKLDWKKYLLVFFITLTIFVVAVSLSNYFTNKKINQIKSIQDSISIDILSSETQFSLLEELACSDVDKTVLSQELNSLAEKITYTENNFSESEELDRLKKYYALLEIKDYLLMKKISERCGTESVFVLYFYTTSENCSECVRQGYVLTSLRESYPGLRVYSFDYSTDLSALRALVSIYKVEDTKLPALVVNGKLYTGYRSVEDIEKAIPELVQMKIDQEKDIDKDSQEDKENN
ncbi:MAG: hypothetical protein KBD26_02725 [Candidatus Pacebacteria bacterium]|nr:hypothetical protein [Candidatus Paceibacterota bacterium]MBP9772724.1 hypothetical protein [Candidatus Paceibacterota bacterium]